MAITCTDVTNMAPELTSVTAGTQTAILAQVALQVSDEAWGELADVGAAYLAAHLATVGKRKGSAGGVASESVGSVSRSYATKSTAVGLSSTAYGEEYERLVGLLPGVRFDVG